MSRKFALTGTGPLSGKSTLAKRLAREYEFIHADHSRTLVASFVLWANNLPNPERSGLVLPITVDEVYNNKEVYRVSLQEHSYRVGFSDPAQAKGWTVLTLAEWLRDTTRDVVFDSFRGEAQAQVMRELGFTLVQIEISEDARIYRAIKSGAFYHEVLDAMNEHPELELGIKSPDITLNGEQDVGVLARSLIFRSTREDKNARR